MALISYSLFRISKTTRKRVLIAALALLVPVGLPFVIAVCQQQLGIDASWFFSWFEPSTKHTGRVAGPYLIGFALMLFLFGLLVADDAAEYGHNSNYDRSFRESTSPYGAISQIMLFLQIAPVFIAIWGGIWLFGNF